MPDKPNCYKCRHRRTIPGDAHSRCAHPAIEGADENPFGAMVQAMNGKFAEAGRQLGITGHALGVARGWFLWPAEFDPTWLLTCNGFEAKDKP